jgi:hypothetical protein
MLACHEQLLRVVQRNRDRNPLPADGDWILAERRVVQQAAYKWAVRHGIETRPTVADVELLEPLAEGATYASKLCLYVAEIMYGLRARPSIGS